MKKALILPLVGLMGLSLASCGPQKIDYSDNPYVGASGSRYGASGGSGDSLIVMMFFFYADGTGAWGYAKSETDVEVYDFHYTITGDVNVSFTEDISKDKGSGYFATISSVGQCFVFESVYFARKG